MLLSDLDFFILKVHVISRVLHTIFSSSQIMGMFIKSPRQCTINNSTPLLWNFFLFWIKRDFKVQWEEKKKKKDFPRLHFCWDDAVGQFLGDNGYHLNITWNITNTLYGQILLFLVEKKKRIIIKIFPLAHSPLKKTPTTTRISKIMSVLIFWAKKQIVLVS